MKKVLEKLDELQTQVLRIEVELTLVDFNTSTDTDIAELRYALEKSNREIIKLENLALNKLYRAVIKKLAEKTNEPPGPLT